MSDLLTAVARRFRLGSPVEGVEVEGGFSNRVVSLTTDRGRFAVKIIDRSLEANRDRRALERAVELELAAVAAGLGAPVPALDDRNQVLASVEGELVRVHQWVVGWSPDSSPADPDLALQVGGWLARLHGLDLPTSARHTSGLVEVADPLIWEAYVGAAAGRTWALDLEAALPWISRAIELVRSNRRDGAALGTHRDLFPRNALVTASGLAVCDWDVAGPWYADEELVAAAVDWSGGILGPVDASSFEAVLDGYRQAGGSPPAPDERIWAGYLEKQLNWLEMHVRRALEPPDPDARATAEHRLPFLVPRLARQVDELPRWVGLLRNHLGMRRSDPLR